MQAGESFTFRVFMFDIRRLGEHGGISVSFPAVRESGGSSGRHSSAAAEIEALDYTTGLSQVAFHRPVATIYHREINMFHQDSGNRAHFNICTNAPICDN